MALRPLDAVAEASAAAASSSTPTTPAHALQASNLHRHLRTNNYHLVREHLSSHPPPPPPSKVKGSNTNTSSATNGSKGGGGRNNHTLLVSNRIGWSAIHFAAASHGSLMVQTRRERERQMTMTTAAAAAGGAHQPPLAPQGHQETVAEDDVDVGVQGNQQIGPHGHHHHHLLNHHMANQQVPLDQFGFAIPQQPPNNDETNNNTSSSGETRGGKGAERKEDEPEPEGGWWRWLLLQIAEAAAGSSSLSFSSTQLPTIPSSASSPFLSRTEAGMTPTDLFFCGHVRPLPWQRPEIHEAARWLRRDMANVCGDNGLISIDNASRLQHRLRQRIEREGRVEWHRQQKEKGRLEESRCREEENEDEEDDEALWLEDVPWDDSILDALVVFWHSMELLLMVAYHGTMDLDIINNHNNANGLLDVKSSGDESDADTDDDGKKSKWRVVHALAYTGCPPEVARLAVCLYPEQVRQRDEKFDLPLHIAVRSRSSSSQWDAAEDDAHAVADIESLVGNGADREVDSVTGQVRQTTLSYTPACAPVIKALLSSYPHAAACADGNGRLPLNLALVSGRTWRSGIADILEACPDALFGTRDTATHLAPFMLAAVDQRELREHGHRAAGGVGGSGVEYEEPDEAELRAKKIATNQIGGMWRFMSDETKQRVLEKVRNDIDIIKLDTIFEILRAMPDAVEIGGVESSAT